MISWKSGEFMEIMWLSGIRTLKILKIWQGLTLLSAPGLRNPPFSLKITHFHEIPPFSLKFTKKVEFPRKTDFLRLGAFLGHPPPTIEKPKENHTFSSPESPRGHFMARKYPFWWIPPILVKITKKAKKGGISPKVLKVLKSAKSAVALLIFGPWTKY